MSANPNDAAVLARLVGDAVGRMDKNADGEARPRYHRWSDARDQTCAGMLVREDTAPDQFTEGRTVRVLILQQLDGALVSVMAYKYVSERLDEFDEGRGVRPGDVIAIRRGELVERTERSYREWTVQVIRPEGTALPASAGGNPGHVPEDPGRDPEDPGPSLLDPPDDDDGEVPF